MATMASGRTPNLGLSQWTAEDYVRREDFNADFAAIDTAVGEAGTAKIKEFIVGTAAAQIDIDVTDIDWEKYQYVYLDVDATGCGVTGTNNIFYWRYNNISDKNYYYAYSNGSEQSSNTYGGIFKMLDQPLETYKNEYYGPRRVKLTVGKTANRRIVSETVDPSKSGLGFMLFLCGVLYSNLETINFYVANGTIPVGVKFTFWGVK